MQKDFLQEQIGQSQTQNREEEFRCKHCGAILTEEDMFCPECGEKVDGEEKTCPVCATTTTSEFCPECGYRIIPAICPECGNECHYDLCEKCGAVINPVVQEISSKQIEEPSIMSDEEQKEIEQIFNKPLSKETEEFIKRIEKHKRQESIRNFVSKREKTIVKQFGKSPVEYKIPTVEEEAFLMKAYEELNKILKARDQETIKKIVQMETYEISEESKRKYEEIQKRFNEMMAQYAKDINDARLEEEKLEAAEIKARKELEEKIRIAEQKAREEKERLIAEQKRIRAAEEAVRRRIAHEAYIKTLTGAVFLMKYGSGISRIHIKRIEGQKIYIYSDIEFTDKTHLYRECEGLLIGNKLDFQVKKVTRDYKSKSNDTTAEKWYKGELNGNIITGYWNECSKSKYFRID